MEITLVTITLWLYITIAVMFFGMEKFMQFYPYIAWLCWITNIVIMELFLGIQSANEEKVYETK